METTDAVKTLIAWFRFPLFPSDWNVRLLDAIHPESACIWQCSPDRDLPYQQPWIQFKTSLNVDGPKPNRDPHLTFLDSYLIQSNGKNGLSELDALISGHIDEVFHGVALSGRVIRGSVGNILSYQIFHLMNTRLPYSTTSKCQDFAYKLGRSGEDYFWTPELILPTLSGMRLRTWLIENRIRIAVPHVAERATLSLVPELANQVERIGVSFEKLTTYMGTVSELNSGKILKSQSNCSSVTLHSPMKALVLQVVVVAQKIWKRIFGNVPGSAARRGLLNPLIYWAVRPPDRFLRVNSKVKEIA